VVAWHFLHAHESHFICRWRRLQQNYPNCVMQGECALLLEAAKKLRVNWWKFDL
jgi:hypothetical protein